MGVASATMRRSIGPREFDFARQVAVMAIVNRTPDSFYDRGRTDSLDAAVAAAHRAIEEGADWIDVGGAKFAPGPPVPVAEELDRVVAGMNVNVWDVNETVQELIRSGARVGTDRLADADVPLESLLP